jgi:hypothetical protein
MKIIIHSILLGSGESTKGLKFPFNLFQVEVQDNLPVESNHDKYLETDYLYCILLVLSSGSSPSSGLVIT